MTNRISKKFAAGCVAEWSGTTGYPKTREGLFCLIDTFQKVSRSEAHARQIVEDLQTDSIYCPRPAEIHRVAISIQPTKITGCLKCDHTGYRDAPPVNGYTMVKPCECRATAKPQPLKHQQRAKSQPASIAEITNGMDLSNTAKGEST